MMPAVDERMVVEVPYMIDSFIPQNSEEGNVDVIGLRVEIGDDQALASDRLLT